MSKVKSERVTTSIKVDPHLWKEVKIHCLTNDMEVSEFIEVAIKKAMKSNQ